MMRPESDARNDASAATRANPPTWARRSFGCVKRKESRSANVPPNSSVKGAVALFDLAC